MFVQGLLTNAKTKIRKHAHMKKKYIYNNAKKYKHTCRARLSTYMRKEVNVYVNLSNVGYELIKVLLPLT